MTLPNDWRQMTLGDVARWGSGGTPKAGTPEYYGGDLPWAVIGDLQDGPVTQTSNTITSAGLEASSAKLIPAPAVLVAMYGSIGKLGITVSPLTTNQAIAFAIPDQHLVEHRFLFYFLMSQREALAAAGKGATQQNIGQGTLKAWSIALPPLPEQRRIVEILEDHLSRLDAAAEQLRLARSRVASLEQQTFRHELTGGLLAKVPSSLPTGGCDDGSLPDLPEGWAWQRLQDLAGVAGGVTKDAKKQSDVKVPEWPYLRVANVQRGRLDLALITRIRVPEIKARSLFLQEGDVLLNEGGDRDKLGRGWIWEGQIEQCIHQNHVFRARVVNGVIEPRLLSWAANTFGGPWCESNGKQSTNLASISLSKIRLMPVPVPPCSVQSQLVQRIDERLISYRRLTEGISVAHSKGLSLRKALLEAAFSGRLTQTTSSEEIQEMPSV